MPKAEGTRGLGRGRASGTTTVTCGVHPSPCWIGDADVYQGYFAGIDESLGDDGEVSVAKYLTRLGLLDRTVALGLLDIAVALHSC